MRSMGTAAIAAAVLVLGACSTYKSSPQMNYYHGQNIPEGFIKVLKASPEEIRFEVRVKFVQKQMYHLILEGNAPVSEGWASTQRAGGESYNVTMKPKEGSVFEAGKTYRLCIGAQNPQAVQMTTSNYPCVADFVFVFQEKDTIMPL
jgi:hypothetical protein